ncbi:helix-turn-helix domain-containing protein [Nonomuraea gerenzanensis]|uniref:Regulatory protein n=1 Tax=Nonomuraea gerenzanensis TaxID=93944 RepID=A0A1M4ECD7_9ACTN|nr:helix-turn-helix domain-containing protein [Nonomuraea gerenzanensis]UBU08318.1 helix-turn-helix domain-containing protein [Nonomuraea gerenzanensis]SBO96651.1 regulatory protein [Nonomuraea gerenzanensis]
MLRRHRQAARLTLEQLAEASGVSDRTLSDMERGRSKGPQHRTVVAVADALGLAGADREQLVELAREGRLRDHWSRPAGLCELPRTVDDFTGRAAELAWISELVHTGDAFGAAGVGLVTGSAGLGKTTLTIRAAHTLRPGFPGGVLFLDLFGMSAQPLPAEEALGTLLRALGVTEIPGEATGRASLYRSVLRDRRVLVVLDNAASEEQVRPLLPGGGAGRALVTSRRLLAGLEGVRRLGLGPLPLLEAAELLTGILKERGTCDDGPAVWQLAQLCGGLPLALRIAGNRLVSRPGWNAADLAARLADEERRLHQLSAGDLRIAGAFGLSYEQLADATRQVFRRLALVPGRDFDAALAAVVGGTPIEGAWDALDELVDLGLLQDSAAGRYRFHDLVRLFARGRLREEESEAEREALTVTVMSWLLRTATVAGRCFESDRPSPGFSSLDEADHWLRVNVDGWLSAMRHAAGAGRFAEVLDCAESMHWFSDRWMHASHWHEVFTLGTEAAAALGDPARQAEQVNMLAWVHLVPREDLETALRHTAQAMDLATRIGATAQIALAHHTAAGALRRLGRLDEAIAAETRAAQIYQAHGDIDRYAQCLGALGTCLRDAGHHAEALERYLALWDLLNDDRSGMTPNVVTFTRPIALARVGECLGLLGHRSEAIGKLTEAIDLMERARLPAPQARALETLAGLLAEESRIGESRQVYGRAAGVYEVIGDLAASSRCRGLAEPTA